MSAKTSTQPGRRTPLSLSGAAIKTHSNKGGGNAANSGGNNANGHTTSNKQDNKQQQSKTEQQPQTANNADTKENPNKKQQQQADKKQQQNDITKKNTEKNQNGTNSNKQQQQANENKQQQNKDKQQQHQNGNDNKINEKEKKEKPEKSEKTDKLEKPQEKVEKEETKVKEDKVKEDKKADQEKPDNKKEEKKPKEVKEAKEDKKEATAKIDEKAEQQQQTVKNDDKKSKEENPIKNVAKKPEEIVDENMDVAEEKQSQQKSPPVTPKTNTKANKTSTPVSKTPTKASEKTPQKSTPSSNVVKTAPVTKREVTTAIDDNDDIEMEPLAIESSPIKSSEREEVAHINIAPSATSTPGKILLPKRNVTLPKTDVQLAMQTGISPERPRPFSQISGRKSIRPISEYTPSKFQSNTQFRESYRRINTELDVTNTSMNVTVGSEVPNNLSFSFFGRGRKRERTPPQLSQSAIGELQTDMDISPPKRARLDMYGFFSAVSSPLSLLRNRFSKATLQSSTPVKLEQILNTAEDEIEVQNVSGVSVHEEIAKSDKEPTETNTTANEDNNASIGEEAKEAKIKTDTVTPTSDQDDSEFKEFTDVSLKSETICRMEQTCEQSDIKITETPLQPAVGDPMAKNKRCIVM